MAVAGTDGASPLGGEAPATAGACVRALRPWLAAEGVQRVGQRVGVCAVELHRLLSGRVEDARDALGRQAVFTADMPAVVGLARRPRPTGGARDVDPKSFATREPERMVDAAGTRHQASWLPNERNRCLQIASKYWLTETPTAQFDSAMVKLFVNWTFTPSGYTSA